MSADTFPRCRVVPLPDQQVAFEIDGRERLRWHFGDQYPRPFFYPFVGPSGETLTRMGHPGAQNHDHHRSIWFAHNKVLGIDFWSDNTDARIRQKHWLAYEDGDHEAIMAVLLGWYDGHDPQELLEQEVIAAASPGDAAELFLEIQTTFRPKAEALEFGQTNFGFLAVRVAKSISAYFGGGKLTNSEGQVDEPNIFGKPAKWMDYSGPLQPPQASGGAGWKPPLAANRLRRSPQPSGVIEGITYFDHPANPNHPAKWHVREDGWMGASVCMDEPISTSGLHPLTLRYLLHAHGGPIDATRANAIAKEFAQRPGFVVAKATARHRQFTARRSSAPGQ